MLLSRLQDTETIYYRLCIYSLIAIAFTYDYEFLARNKSSEKKSTLGAAKITKQYRTIIKDTYNVKISVYRPPTYLSISSYLSRSVYKYIIYRKRHLNSPVFLD